MAIDILHKILAFGPCQFDRLLVFSVLTARLSTGSPSFSFSFPHKLAKKRRLSENALSLRTSAHAPPFVIANQRARWCGNLGRCTTSFQREGEDSHGSDIGHCLGMTMEASLRTGAHAPLRHCEPVHRLPIFTSSFLHSFIPKIPSRFVGCS